MLGVRGRIIFEDKTIEQGGSYTTGNLAGGLYVLESTVGGHNVVFTLYSTGLNVIQADAAQIVVTGNMSGVTVTNNASARAFTLRRL